MTAEFQDNALIMGGSINIDSLLFQSSDADIPFIAGDEYLALKEFTKEGYLELVSTSLITLQNIWRFLSDKAKQGTKLKDAKHSIFKGVTDHKMRALMCLLLGYDVYVKGMVGVDPKGLEEIIRIKYNVFLERCPYTSRAAYLKKYIFTNTLGL